MESEHELRIAQRLEHLARLSFVAHRDTSAALPALLAYGTAGAADWVDACEALFLHDREAGKAFIRASAAAAQAFHGTAPWVALARRFCACRSSARALEAYMQALPEAAALLGENAGQWAEIGLQWCARHTDSGRAYFETPVATLAPDGDPGTIGPLLAPAEELYADRGLALGRYLAGALRVRALLGAEALGPWARQGGDILKAGRQRGEAFFALESEESRTLLLTHLPGFRPLEHERLFLLLLTVWLGAAVPLKEGAWMPGEGRPFIETDGRSLFLPAVLGDREEALLAILHAAAHLAHGTFDQDAIEALFRHAGVRHPPLASDQAMTWRPVFVRYGEDLPRFQVLFDLCEDLRVDVRTGARVPRYLERLVALAEAAPRPSGPERAYWEFALAALQAVLGRGMIDPRLEPLLDPGSSLPTSFAAAEALYADGGLPPLTSAARARAYLPAHGPNAARPVYPRRPGMDEAGATADTDPEVQKSETPKETAKNAPQDAQGNDPDLEIPPEDTAGAGGRVGVGLPQPARVSGVGRGVSGGEQGYAYPEWDYRERRFRRRWAFVQEKQLEELDHAEAGRILTQHAAVLGRLKRAVQAQKPTRLAPLTRQLEGDDLDMEATVNFVAERRQGLSPRPAIYRARRPQRRDLAALLLADLSTSIMQQLPEGGRIVDRIRAALLLFAESLEEVGDPYAIAGFASKYRDQVSYYPIKGFGERLDSHARGLIGGLSGRLATRMGAAIRHALVRFDEAQAARRLLLLLSDGRPADYDDGGDSRYLEEDTRLAIKGCLDRGVHPFCITLDPRGGDYLHRIFGEGHYLVIDRLNDLPERLPEVYLRLRGA